jgi:hypothetical protein
MLAYRTTWIVKEGRMQEALEDISAEIERSRPLGIAARVYTPSISPNVLFFDTVYEDEAAHRAFWDAYNADSRNSPKGKAFWAKWGEATERSTGTERWNVVEWR